MTIQQKRILIVTREIVPFHYGGIGTQFKSLARFLRRRGHDVAILTERPVLFNERLFRDHYGDVSVFFTEPYPSIAVLRPWYYAENVADVFDDLYQANPPDVVICADFEAEGLLLFLKAAGGHYGKSRFILTINGMTREVLSVYEGEVREGSAFLQDPAIRLICAIEDLCVLLAPEIVSPSKVAWGKVQDRLSPPRLARIIPNFVDHRLFGSENLGTTAEAPSKIVFVGRLDRLKGPDLLLKAYLDLFRDRGGKLPDIIFIGRDCFWKSYSSTFLEHWLSRLPAEMSRKITFLGQVEHGRIIDYLRQAVFCVFPSRWEAYGIVCLEAMMMGCPVLIPRGTGLEEVLGLSFPGGLFTHDDDGQDLKERIRLLLDYPPAVEVRQAVRQRALQLEQEAERYWTALIEDHPESRDQWEAGTKWSNAVLALLSLLRSRQDEVPDHLKIYFSCKRHYDESNSVRIVYPRNRWKALSILLPGGTGDPELRMDPSECPGTVILRQVLLTDQQGEELWRSDASNRFQGIRFIGKGQIFLRSESYVLHAADNDPQLLLDCPAIEKPVLMTVVLYAGEGDDAAVS